MKGHLILKKNTVILSVNNDEGHLCVDIFIRENKTFGFEEYRKDPENIDGWYKVGNYSDKIYKNQKGIDGCSAPQYAFTRMGLSTDMIN